jgi:hypothetical protein
MKIGTIEIEGTGLTNGHPAVIISGKIKAGIHCKINGLLQLDKTTGKFEDYNFTTPSGAACIALEPIATNADSAAAKVLLHGTFSGDKAVKADGSPLSAAELAAVQANSQIYFV